MREDHGRPHEPAPRRRTLQRALVAPGPALDLRQVDRILAAESQRLVQRGPLRGRERAAAAAERIACEARGQAAEGIGDQHPAGARVPGQRGSKAVLRHAAPARRRTVPARPREAEHDVGGRRLERAGREAVRSRDCHHPSNGRTCRPLARPIRCGSGPGPGPFLTERDPCPPIVAVTQPETAHTHDPDVSRSELKEATFTGVRWVLVARMVGEICAFGGAVTLARLIPPAEFGHAAVALAIAPLAVIVTFEGCASALVQRKTVSRADFEGATVLSLAVRPDPDAADRVPGGAARLFRVRRPDRVADRARGARLPARRDRRSATRAALAPAGLQASQHDRGARHARRRSGRSRARARIRARCRSDHRRRAGDDRRELRCCCSRPHPCARR